MHEEVFFRNGFKKGGAINYTAPVFTVSYDYFSFVKRFFGISFCIFAKSCNFEKLNADIYKKR